MQHSFDINIAEKYGINEAIILNNFQFWIAKNKANDRHLHDGHYWTYNSVKALLEIFPYLNKGAITRAIGNLVDEGILVKGNYNENPYDHTLWYAITDFGYSILQNKDFDLLKTVNRNIENGKCITDINTDINSDINTYNTVASDFFLKSEKTNSLKSEKKFKKEEGGGAGDVEMLTKDSDDKAAVLYKDMVALYCDFYRAKTGLQYPFGAIDGKGIKECANRLKKMATDNSDAGVLKSFEYILTKWDQLDPFIQKNIKPIQIAAAIPNIVMQFKNKQSAGILEALSRRKKGV